MLCQCRWRVTTRANVTGAGCAARVIAAGAFADRAASSTERFFARITESKAIISPAGTALTEKSVAARARLHTTAAERIVDTFVAQQASTACANCIPSVIDGMPIPFRELASPAQFEPRQLMASSIHGGGEHTAPLPVDLLPVRRVQRCRYRCSAALEHGCWHWLPAERVQLQGVPKRRKVTLPKRSRWRLLPRRTRGSKLASCIEKVCWRPGLVKGRVQLPQVV